MPEKMALLDQSDQLVTKVPREKPEMLELKDQ